MDKESVASLHTESAPFENGSLRDPRARERASRLAAEGYPIGVFNRGVCAIWGDGENPDFVETVARIKGELRQNRPLAATLNSRELIEIVDTSKIPPDLGPIFTNADELTQRFGSLAFFRVPIREEAVESLPAAMVSRMDDEDKTPVIQNWDAHGHKPTHLFIERMKADGIKYPAVTSMNISGTPEIVDQMEGAEFSRNHGIPIFLNDPKDKGVVKGSYTIFGIDEGGLRLVRDGNIPGRLFTSLFDGPFEESGAAAPKYPQHEFPSVLTQDLSPSQARIAIISYVDGWPVDKIRHALLPTSGFSLSSDKS